MATLHPNIAPYGDIFMTADGHKIMLAIGSDQQFKKLVDTLNFLQPIPVYLCNNQSRIRHRSQLNEYLQSKISEFTNETLSKLLTNNGLPFGHVKDISEVFENDLAKKMIIYDNNDAIKPLLSISSIAFQKMD
jgi:crotonobetainyl-CoA:carnitine CoA-transferase CaiB-like acyl-CoA transferase